MKHGSTSYDHWHVGPIHLYHLSRAFTASELFIPNAWVVTLGPIHLRVYPDPKISRYTRPCS